MNDDLTQEEADAMFETDKMPKGNCSYIFPEKGEKLSIPFVSSDSREEFLFDISRHEIKVSKITYQNRVRKIFPLRRLDIDGPPHKNPTVEEIPLPFLTPYNGALIRCPHLHIYVEFYMDKWAVPADIFLNLNPNDLFENMVAFSKYCNIINLPPINMQDER